jgi:hypothetical protein
MQEDDRSNTCKFRELFVSERCDALGIGVSKSPWFGSLSATVLAYIPYRPPCVGLRTADPLSMLGEEGPSWLGRKLDRLGPGLVRSPQGLRTECPVLPCLETPETSAFGLN